SHDGIAAAQSGAAADGTAVTLQTTVTGPGSISFWWKVSSESNNDFLKFFISGVQQTRISGEVEWQRQSFSIPAGSQVLKWTYSKSASGSGGMDRGWVDQVQFTVVTNGVCEYALSPTDRSHSAGSSTGLVTVVTGSDCSWSAANTNSWVSFLSGSTGTGNGSVSYSVTANPGGQPRSGIINIGGQNFVINQEGSPAPCVYSLAEAALATSSASSTGFVTVVAPFDCPWTVINPSTWIIIASATNGTGTGHIRYIVTANASALARSGGIQIGGRTFMITQSGTPSSDPIVTAPANQTVSVGTTVNFSVTATGTGPFTYQWQFNGVGLSNGAGVSGATSATLTLVNVQESQAGVYRVLVTGGAGTTFSPPATLEVPSALPLSLALDTEASGLVWTTSGAAPWSGQTTTSHDGADAARTGAIDDASSSSIHTVVTGPGTLTFWWKVSSEADHDYLKLYVNGSEQMSISGEADWQLRTVSLSSGSQLLEWRYIKNSSLAAGQDRGWVDQVQFAPAATCTFAVAPTSRTHGYGAASNSLTVATSAGCTWTVINSNAWLTITSGANGSGSGTVGYAVAPNTAALFRSGFIVIAGQLISISQQGMGGACVYSLSVIGHDHGTGADLGSINLSATAGCAWMASSTASWLTIVSPTNGTGSAIINYSVAANAGAARSASINVGGQVFTVNQEGVACSYAISPASAAHGAASETGFVSVTSISGCQWSVANSNNWVTILFSANSSSGLVRYKVAPNFTGTARSGTIVVAGRAFAVSQSAGELPPAVAVGPVQVSSIGHSFFNPNRPFGLPGPQMPCSVLDYLIDQRQATGGGSVLPNVSVNWDTNVQFSITVSAPPGKKFMVHVPAGRAAGFGGFLWWESTRGGFSGAGTVQVSFEGLEGGNPDFSGASPVLSDSHGFWGFADLEGGTFTNDLAFSSITLTATILPQYTGNGTEAYIPHHESALQIYYTTPETNDPGRFVSIVPSSLPLLLAPSVSAIRQPNGDVTLSFDGTLEYASEVGGNYEPVPGSPQGFYTIPKENLLPQRYFRARKNSP
ncbi:MAG: hypothetical protein QOF48_1001, partial [Verrucomicrobiota bacterium]